MRTGMHAHLSHFDFQIPADSLPSSPTGTPTDGVPITDLTLSDITGSVSSDAAPCT